ncbi:serine hydrolase domain-containing protein [Caulobacter sp. NIBR2454]|uniref:serine hydrolase domain-containing protein n=1 Tax=Caulobacter sp. NIBR2454 TaxID=3015996 RepID=UPI0022B60C28|nr:serine hydrolase domain-containing protein [Caulobacter sp. NIBR2454]
MPPPNDRRRFIKTVGAAAMAGWALPASGAAAHVASRPKVLRLQPRRIDSALDQMVAAGRVAGASALIWQGGRERYFHATGFADREARRPLDRRTLFQIYSMTKPVTGVALMQLWEQGRFHLDDPIARYLPQFAQMQVDRGAGGLSPASRPVLIRDLLRHTAGLSYGSGETAADLAYKRADPLNPANDLAEAGRRLASLPLLADPGEIWSYSAAVDVQALLVETLAGEPFEAHVRRRVLEPLKMADTGWTQPAAKLDRLATVYVGGQQGGLVRQSDEQTRANNFAPSRRLTMGGAGLVSSIDDYMRFCRMLLAGGTLDGAKILKPSTIRLMASDQLDPAITSRHFLPSKGSVGFGFDFAVRTAPPADPAENRGEVGEFFWDGYASTLFWIDPANDLAAVFLVQRIPFDGTLHHDFRNAVYGEA